MARSAMTVRQRPAGYDILPLSLAALDAFDNVNGMTVPVNGRTELIFLNTGVTATTVTITSVADPNFKRKGDITALSIPASGYAIFQEFPAIGWASGGVMAVDASATLLKYLALTRADGA